MHSLYSINNLLTVFFWQFYLQKTIDLVSFLFSFRFEVNENKKITTPT
jgi:hypothetical protein